MQEIKETNIITKVKLTKTQNNNNNNNIDNYIDNNNT